MTFKEPSSYYSFFDPNEFLEENHDCIDMQVIYDLEIFVVKACQALYIDGNPQDLSDALESVCALLQIRLPEGDIKVMKKASHKKKGPKGNNLNKKSGDLK